MLNGIVYAKIRKVYFVIVLRRIYPVFSYAKAFILPAALILSAAAVICAQDAKPTASPTPQPTASPKKFERPKIVSGIPKTATAAEVAEYAIGVYSGLRGRDSLNQIRRTTIESGKLSVTNADGTVEQANYTRRILRGDNIDKERLRLDQEFPNARFSLVLDGTGKVFGLFNDTVFSPRQEAVKTFQNQIRHNLDTLLRFKENGSSIELVKRDKISNVDYVVVDVTDKEARKTRFYVSAKTARVMWLEYTEDGVKYTRKFSDYNYSQNTLVPFRTILLANDKLVEEATISTVTFGQKVEEDVFKAG
jgi:hypothetical protein